MAGSRKPIIGIVGGTHGLGNWFKIFFEKNKYKVLVSGRKTKLTNVELAKKSDIVIISVPINATYMVIEEILPHLKDDSLLMDFTSLKKEPIEEMKKAKKTVGVIGLHPMFGPLVTSIKDQYIAVCPVRENNLWSSIKDLFEKNMANLMYIKPAEHDKQMAFMQALVHFMNLAYIKTLSDSNMDINSRLSTPVFRLQTMIAGRILGQNPHLYADLQMKNPAFAGILDSYEEIVKEAKKTIKNKDTDAFVENFEDLKKELEIFIKTSEIKTSSILEQQDKTDINITFAKTASGKIKTVSYLGPAGTHTHAAASFAFSGKELIASNTISSVFEKIINGNADAGIVPAENSTEGVVCETYDNLVNSNVVVNDSIKQLIHHNLLARTKDIHLIKTVVSHPQAIAQTREWLRKNLPNAELATGASTTKVINQYKDSAVAFIGTKMAAKEYGLNILAEYIEDLPGNATEFYIISKNKKLDDIYKAKKTMIAVTIYDRIGILKDILCVFSKHSVNLTKLFSRPSRVKQWDYYFFIELDIKQTDCRMRKILDDLKEYCPLVKILGGT